MPITVVTLTNVPISLRGDLTKWLQEISTGVYVGNINSRVREELWARIIDNIKNGQATMSYEQNNELGYDFLIHNTNREVIYYDGIPLVFLPSSINSSASNQMGFSNASKNEKIKRARIKNRGKTENINKISSYVVLDIETTGVNLHRDQIIEVAALKVVDNEQIIFHELLRIKGEIPNEISVLTGITDEMLVKDGKSIDYVLKELLDFLGDAILVGYNIRFDLSFINVALKNNGYELLKNRSLCLLKEIKRKQKFLKNYKLNTVLMKYDIKAEGLHRAYVDVVAEYELALKLNVFE